MKKYYLILMALFSLIAHAQIVNIPDAAFKNTLLNYQPAIDTNSDGQIQNSEALAVTSLNFLTQASDITGIESFQNLTYLKIEVALNLTSINISGLTQLQTLLLPQVPALTSATLTGLTGLTKLQINGTQSEPVINFTGNPNVNELDLSALRLTALDLSGFPNLHILNCSRNLLPSLDLSPVGNLTTLDCNTNHLTALDVSGLTNLTNFRCDQNQLTTINVLPLTQLTQFNCNYNSITNLNLSTLSQLTNLDCSVNNLSALDITPLTNLISLGCGTNNINALDVSHCMNLHSILCSGNHLTTLDVTALPNLGVLRIENNQIAAIDLTQNTKLHIFFGANNPITTLDFSHVAADPANGDGCAYQINDMPNLEYVNLKSGITQHYGVAAYNSPNLAYICVNESLLSYFASQLAFTGAQINSYCTFVPGIPHNIINGSVTIDTDNNGCSASDAHFPVKVGISDGVEAGATFTQAANGGYTFYTQTGNFTLTPVLENAYFAIIPASTTINFTNTNNNSQTQDFCIAPVGVHNDVEITLWPSPAHPGFDSNYHVSYKNKGNQIQSGSISFTFNDAVLDFVSSTQIPSSNSAGNLVWNYNNLAPFESRQFDFTLNLNGPTETPPVNIGDILNYTTTINPVSGDETPADNVFELHQTVVGSFDPNDKTCLEGNTIAPEKVGDYLHYVIRFQNSGTAAAENVVVKDIIDTAKFDVSSLQLIASSHPQTTRINGNKVEFIFENINLPAESNDEPGSHGYVAFKIKTKNNLVVGNSVSNTADIYFDYNFPITTNTTTTAVTLLAKDSFADNSVSFYPNPVKDKLQVSAKDKISSIQLFDVQGRLIETAIQNDKTVVLDLSKNKTGVYFVKVYTDKGVKVEKVIKE